MTMAELFKDYPIPVAHNHFSKSPSLPFLVWDNPNTSNIFADDTVFLKVEDIEVSLYTRKDPQKEETFLEEWLTSRGFCWELISRVWDDQEKMYWSHYDVWD